MDQRGHGNIYAYRHNSRELRWYREIFVLRKQIPKDYFLFQEGGKNMSDYQKTSVQHLIKEKAGAVGKKVRLEGWVRSNRSQKEFGFIVLNDGSFFESMQIVYDQSLENWQEAAKIRVGSAVTVDGEVVLSPKEAQPIEIKAHKIVLEGDSPEDYPIQPKRHTREFLRKNAHLRARKPICSMRCLR